MQGPPSSGGFGAEPQGPAPDEAASLELIVSIGRAFKFVDDYVRPRMQKHGLTMTEFSVLMVLWQHGPTPLGELSERILLTGASTTYTVKKLEKRGLIARESRSEDKRVVTGVITEKGRTLARKIAPLHATELAEAMHRLSTEEKKTAAKLLSKLRGLGPNER
ncbi:Transcriptional regulator, MarR family [Acidisarcina polymorpha]|uniref:Transcriptional regulator, MarR family n=1 Tax=Acidisarcina polymorpha TaxID=2211140 RepID=A0A2Z5G4M1_9BACT|nr:MarR family transcriptional regulator [Acidisarcina polymorpha]AXC14048.1 Transcriptional regulator, MarR family [Acidisarcina polymorpha]